MTPSPTSTAKSEAEEAVRAEIARLLKACSLSDPVNGAVVIDIEFTVKVLAATVFASHSSKPRGAP
jgi:hypothetical protein